MSNQQQISIRSARRDCCLRTHLQDRHSTTHTEHIAINVQNYLHNFSLWSISRTCRVSCSSRGQTWTRLEMPWLLCADRIPLRSCHASRLISPPLPNEPRPFPNAVPRPEETCRTVCSSISTVSDHLFCSDFVCGVDDVSANLQKVLNSSSFWCTERSYLSVIVSSRNNLFPDEDKLKFLITLKMP